jgi:molybdopterin-binding protein
VVARGEPLEVFGAPILASVARLTGVENVFEGQVIARDEGGTMTVEATDRSGSCRLEIPLSDRRIGERVLVAVPSGEIILATEEPHLTSARNILRGRISSIEQKSARVLVGVESGVTWQVTVTHQSVRELKLATGMQVWLAFKTYSCFLLDE